MFPEWTLDFGSKFLFFPLFFSLLISIFSLFSCYFFAIFLLFLFSSISSLLSEDALITSTPSSSSSTPSSSATPYSLVPLPPLIKRKRKRSILELAQSIIDSGTGNFSAYNRFKPKPLLADSTASHLKLDLIWLEQLMARNASSIGNLLSGRLHSGSSISCRLDAKTRKIRSGKMLEGLNLLKVMLKDGTVFVNVSLLQEGQDNGDSRLVILLDKL